MTRAEKIEAAARALVENVVELSATSSWFEVRERHFDALRAALSEEEGTPAGRCYCSCDGCKCCTEPWLSHSPATPSEGTGLCPHLRCGTRDGKPWTCADCGARRIDGKWIGGSGRATPSEGICDRCGGCGDVGTLDHEVICGRCGGSGRTP